MTVDFPGGAIGAPMSRMSCGAGCGCGIRTGRPRQAGVICATASAMTGRFDRVDANHRGESR